tara:strand:- start:325 stop:1272 length:948 start_codon:yes stop_codon:yes gene_type:complete
MLNRRFLRIKILQSLYAYYQSGDKDQGKYLNDLFLSIDRIYELYLYLILSITELNSLAKEKFENKTPKIFPTKDDIDPNMKWIENTFVSKIINSIEFNNALKKHKVSLIGVENKEMLKKVFKQIIQSETYFEYMNNSTFNFDEDKLFVLDLFKNEIANSELLHHFFEEKSMYWIHDLDHACAMVLKTLKKVDSDDSFSLLPLYKEKDNEKDFIVKLYQNTIKSNEENERLITKLADNWELDRIAKLDVILLKMGIAELQTFREIPTKVTLNEIIEIAKYYSTPKSSNFVNGILDKAVESLDSQNKIIKSGRGLKE